MALTSRHGWDYTKEFAEAMARMVAAEDPDHYLAVMSKQKRKGLPHATPTTTFPLA